MYDLEQQTAPRKPARKAQRRVIPPYCAICNGKPWLVTGNPERRAVERCTCERGQFFRAADARRAERSL